MTSRRYRSVLSPLQLPVLRFAIIIGSDAVIAAACLSLAFFLRFDGLPERAYVAAFPLLLSTLIPSRLIANGLMSVHRWSFRFSGLQDAARVAAAVVMGTGLFVLAAYLAHVLEPPRSVVAMELLMTGAGMVAIRFIPRLGWTYWTQVSLFRRGDARRTLIVGAGAAGQMLLGDLLRSGAHRFRVVGFIDDTRADSPGLVGGRPVFGGMKALPETIRRHAITDILIAISHNSQGIVRDVFSRCAGLDVKIKALPVSFAYLQERGALNLLHDLSPEDLLARRHVDFGADERHSFAGRRVVVTGAAGSIGSEICHQLLELGVGDLLALDINENGLYLLERRVKREYPTRRFTTELADIRDGRRIETVMQQFRPQDVFHAAAHKHVPLMEAAPCEAVKNNIIGTSHVLRAAERVGVECVVFISTDKAVAPTSVMGATKRVGEIMTRAITERSKVRGCAVRFGNVLGSAGSVVPLFMQQIEAGGPVTVTDPEVRRYFMTIPEAVGLVLKAACGRAGELCVLNMGEPVRILDLARQMIVMTGHVPDVDIKIVVTGLRPGEKMNEELMMEDEEVTLKTDGRINVVRGAAPRTDLWDIIHAIGQAAADEDVSRTLDLLKVLVPSYRRPSRRTETLAS